MLEIGAGGVLWDLDGTLVDSSEHHWIAWRDILAAEGYPVTPGAFAASFGHRNDTILRALLGPDLPDDDISRIGLAKEALYRKLVREHGLVAIPGARQWLERLKAAGWRQAIASSAPHENIAVAMEAIGAVGFFDALVSADEV